MFRYPAMLVLAAAIWGLGTVVVKDSVESLPPTWLVGVRFLSAGIILCVVFIPRLAALARMRRLADHVRAGLILGLLVVAAYLLNTTGLTGTTAAKSSFLTGVYCVLVPFQSWIVLRKPPEVFNVAAAFLCLAGIGLVSLPSSGGLSVSWGDAVTLCSAVFLGFHVVATSALAPGRDMLVLTAFQFLFGGIAAIGLSAAIAPDVRWELFARPELTVNLVYLVVFATCVALLLQNVGLSHVPPAPGALLLSTESVFGVLFSILLLGERLTSVMVAGFALIFVAVLISEWLPQSKFIEKRHPRS